MQINRKSIRIKKCTIKHLKKLLNGCAIIVLKVLECKFLQNNSSKKKVISIFVPKEENAKTLVDSVIYR